MEVDDVVCAGECAFKLEISICVRCLQRQELYHPALKVYASIFTPFWDEIIKSLREKDYVRYRGAVCNKNSAHRCLSAKKEMPRIIILGGALDYQRVSDFLSSFYTLLQREIDYLKMAVAKIKAHQI